jgi:hypothetical protein
MIGLPLEKHSEHPATAVMPAVENSARRCALRKRTQASRGLATLVTIAAVSLVWTGAAFAYQIALLLRLACESGQDLEWDSGIADSRNGVPPLQRGNGETVGMRWNSLWIYEHRFAVL